MGEGALRCSLTLSPKDLPDSSMYELGTLDVWALVMIDDSCLFGFVVFVLRVDQGCS